MPKLATRIWFHFMMLVVVAGVSTTAVILATRRPLALVAIFLVGGALVSRGLARRLSRPIERLTEANRRFGEGDLAYRIPTPPWARWRTEHRRRHRKHRDVRDEILELLASWNTMAGRIQELVAGQRELLANVSHELRSPLARIRVALELLPHTPDSERRIADLEQDLEELDRLIGAILADARLDVIQPARERVELAPLFRTLADRAANDPSLTGKSVDTDGAGVTAFADPTLLSRALWNLVENAGKYGAAPIRLAAQRDDEAHLVRISVSDDGPGVPPDEREKVLEPFVRGDRAHTPGGGYGLGLSLVRRVAALHGGAVSIGPAHIDQGRELGCKVTISLPSEPSQNFTSDGEHA
jgi:signal transduction histidine kinase